MIPPPQLPWQPDEWRGLLRGAIRDSHTLLARLGLDPAQLAVDARPEFPTRVPEPFVARMQVGNPNDPLLLQVLAQIRERLPVDGFGGDPLHESDAELAPGLLQKYAGRALLIVTQACAVHCRYCFRRHFDYAGQRDPGWQAALTCLAARPDIHEVILSGGDPLSLDDDALTPLLDAIDALPHVQRIRIHTRLPVVLPQRVTPALLDRLATLRARLALVVHVNHANELDADTATAFAALRTAGVTLLNQAVLLRAVNDNVDTLARLSETLFAQGVVPYYLHLLDPVDGTAHFATSEQRTSGLQRALQARLPGYLVPRLVRELPGRASKVPLEQLGTTG